MKGPTRTYFATNGFRDGEAFGVTGGKVSVRQIGMLDRPLTHHVYHSPDGFAWGYGGSGPSELAKDLLWDFLGRRPEPAVYQHFKEDFIAPLDSDKGWEIRELEIVIWFQAKHPEATADAEERTYEVAAHVTDTRSPEAIAAAVAEALNDTAAVSVREVKE